MKLGTLDRQGCSTSRRSHLVAQWPPSSSSDSQNLTTDPPTGREKFLFLNRVVLLVGESVQKRPRISGDHNSAEERESEKFIRMDMDQIVVCANRPDSGSITEGQKTPNMSGSARTRKLLTPFMSPVSLPSQPHDPSSDSLLLSKLAVSSALARACRLSRYEAQLDEFLSKVEHVPAQLKTGNDSPLNKMRLSQDMGNSSSSDKALVSKKKILSIFLNGHFKKVLREFDFERRLRVLNDKLSMAIELQGRLFEFSNSAFEIAHAVYAADHYHE
ncbi:hypothetical protein H4Q26_012331 [Puccinia striiformis f. sp. tritici PST-130]|nr:hypothetical protein H4Q26_012331 [Puccinia striiformis f. sp. tritici PST-130]